LNGGDIKVSGSLLDDIGKAVAIALVKRDSDEVRTRVLLIQSAVITQNQILGYARQANPGKRWDIVNLNTEDVSRRSWEAFNKSDRSPETMPGFTIAGSFGAGLGLFYRCCVERCSQQWLKSMSSLNKLKLGFV
jgi:hypothetical protein